jgi:antitoxin ParD1/3/4
MDKKPSRDRINARLTKPLADHVERMVGENGLYETPSEYVRSLIRRDMESDKEVVFNSILQGYKDMKEGRYIVSSGNFDEDMRQFELREANGWK